MAQTTVVKRGTGMPDSDLAEVTRLAALDHKAWIISSPTLGSNATTASVISFYLVQNGQYVLVTANAGIVVTGTVATSTTSAFIFTINSGATSFHSYVCGGASLAAITMPTTIAAGETPIGMTFVACTATGFNGGTNSLGDSSYVVSHVSFTGPAGMMLTTENFSLVPG